MSQLNASKIITSPETAKAQAERVNAALTEKEKRVGNQINEILKAENCTIDMPLQVSYVTGIRAGGFHIIALERITQ